MIPNAGSRYRVACFCQKCHWHVDITIIHNAKSCPQLDSPLHHFVDFQLTVPESEYYYARCSSCDATLHIEYRPARLNQSQIDLLTDWTLLQNRYEQARIADPDRHQLKAAKPLEVLDAFSCYIRDSLQPIDTHRAVPRLNRRFLLSFGEDCNELLQSIGFVKTPDNWQLPTPPDPDPYEYNLRKHLEDIQEEIWAVMRKYMQSSSPENMKLRAYTEKAPESDADLQLLLGTIEYDKTRTTRRAPILNQDEEMWYTGLGALGDFSDKLIKFAFDKQVETDPYGMPFYFDCFCSIADKRDTEALQMDRAILASQDYYGREEIAKAYQYFTVEPGQAHAVSDDHIRGLFETRLASSGVWQHKEIRENLRIIARSRGSKELEDTAENGMFYFISIHVRMRVLLCPNPNFMILFHLHAFALYWLRTWTLCFGIDARPSVCSFVSSAG
jgi:ubiquitin carboxyl-terminal hydrolase 25/28